MILVILQNTEFNLDITVKFSTTTLQVLQLSEPVNNKNLCKCKQLILYAFNVEILQAV